MDAVSHPQLAERMVAIMASALQMDQQEPLKRKRGRPRKHEIGASASTPLVTKIPDGQKKRGRPVGSGKKQHLPSQGLQGQGFTPHVITVAPGEDVVTKIMSFSQLGSRAVCVLSANGAISNVILRQPATSGGTVTYEGRFEILSLSGSFLLKEMNGTRSRTGGLSVSLASPEGHVVGGGVSGLLIAASPVQVVLGSFIPESQTIALGGVTSAAEQSSGQGRESGIPFSTVSVVGKNGMKVVKSASPSRFSFNQATGGGNNVPHSPGQNIGFEQSMAWTGR